MPNLVDSSKPPNRRARLFRNGSNQAIRIPREFEFSSKEVVLRREGDGLVIEPHFEAPGLLATLRTLTPIDESFPNVDEGLPSLDEPSL